MSTSALFLLLSLAAATEGSGGAPGVALPAASGGAPGANPSGGQGGSAGSQGRVASRPTVPPRSAEAILADHVNAIGGAAALSRHKSLHIKRAVSIKGMDIKGTEERFGTSGNKFLSITTIPGIGTIRQGSDGKTFWSEDPINGVRLLEGAEREQARLDSQWNGELQIAKLYKKVAPVPPPDGAPAVALECLELTPALGLPTTACFDARTHERVYQAGRQTTPQGEIPFEAHFTDWRAFDGVKLPTYEHTTAGPTAIEARVTDVKFDEPIDPGLFKIKTKKSPSKK